jgi:hypothetical protein
VRPTLTRMSSLLPVRKRRRPAYSCTECRRRKVRCDRAIPCGQCTAQKVASLCAYDDNRRIPLQNHEGRGTHSDRKRDERTKNTTEEARIANRSSEVSRPTNNTGRFQGTVSKTRVFGKGHWMSLFSMVIPPFLRTLQKPRFRLTNNQGRGSLHS